MFTIQAHGVFCVNQKGINTTAMSPAQQRLLIEPMPIRVCGAPTGAGKTYVFLQAAKQGGVVVFVVPTQALGKDIEASAQKAQVPAFVWDGTQSEKLRLEGQEPWFVRQNQWDELTKTGGLLVTTPETLGAILLGKPQLVRGSLNPVNLLNAQHIVFDEAHTLTARAFGFLHFWAVLAVHWHRIAAEKAPKLSLLSATHSNLFNALWGDADDDTAYVPKESVAVFDESIVNGCGEELRLLHGDVEIVMVLWDFAW